MKEESKGEIKQIILLYIIISKISLIIQLYIQFYHQQVIIQTFLFKYYNENNLNYQKENTYWLKQIFIIFYLVSRVSCFFTIILNGNVRIKRSNTFVPLLAEDIYLYKDLEMSNYCNQQDIFLECIHSETDFLLSDQTFQLQFKFLFKIIYINNFLLLPNKILVYLWGIDNEGLINRIISLFMLASIAIDMYFYQMNQRYKGNLKANMNQFKISNVLLKDILLTILNFIVCTSIIQVCFYYLDDYIMAYLLFNFIFTCFFYGNLNRYEYSQTKQKKQFLKQLIFFKDIGFKAYKIDRQYKQLEVIPINQMTKYIGIQQTFLMTSYIFALFYTQQVTQYNAFILVLSAFNLLFYTLRFFYFIDIININSFKQIQLDNQDNLRKLMYLYDTDKSLYYFKNLKRVVIDIPKEQIYKEAHAVKCLLSYFETSEIFMPFHSRQNFKNSKYQTVIFSNVLYYEFSYLEYAISQKMSLPQIIQFEFGSIKKKTIINLIKLLLKSSALIKFQEFYEYLYSQQNSKKKHYCQYNSFIDQLNIISMQVLVFQKLIEKHQEFNPSLILIDLYID